jgi:hypothetical protein
MGGGIFVPLWLLAFGAAASRPPDPADVRAGVAYSDVVPPDPADVRAGVTYEYGGVTYVGTLFVPAFASSVPTTDIEASVFGQLAGYGPLVTAVGDRIYPGEADPDAPRPVVVYSLDGTEPVRLLTGALSFQRHTFTVRVDAMHKDEARRVAATVRDALDRQAFGVAQRAYWVDESADETADGYESVQTFTVIQ